MGGNFILEVTKLNLFFFIVTLMDNQKKPKANVFISCCQSNIQLKDFSGQQFYFWFLLD